MAIASAGHLHARRSRVAAALLGIVTIAASGNAQTPVAARATASSPPARDVCPYAQCALGIAPVWNGLMVVRGSDLTPVANLQFFWPSSVAASMRGDSARVYAERAFTVRRRAAVLTDVGALLLLAGAVRGAQAGRVDTPSRVILATGAASFAVSIPLQFSADAWLSRAVWWHNSAYSR